MAKRHIPHALEMRDLKYGQRSAEEVPGQAAVGAALRARMCRSLWVEPGKTSEDGLVSVDLASCTGMCDHEAHPDMADGDHCRPADLCCGITGDDRHGLCTEVASCGPAREIAPLRGGG